MDENRSIEGDEDTNPQDPQVMEDDDGNMNMDDVNLDMGRQAEVQQQQQQQQQPPPNADANTINLIPSDLESHPAIRALLNVTSSTTSSTCSVSGSNTNPTTDMTPAASPSSLLTMIAATPSSIPLGVSFLITDPCQPGNPIIYTSPAFLELTKYPMERVLGRNCRFMQGPATDPVVVSKIRRCVESATTNTSVVLLNYRYDGTTFWNHLLISPLMRDTATGSAKYFLGVQYEVSPERARVQQAMEDGSNDGSD